MVNICHDVSDPGPAMGLSIDDHSFKLYMLDTGLLISASFLSNIDTYTELYDMMLRGKLNVNKGMLLENMVAQELVAKNYELLFCRFQVKETNNPQEVDFLLVKNGRVLPIEVKSGADSTPPSGPSRAGSNGFAASSPSRPQNAAPSRATDTRRTRAARS